MFNSDIPSVVFSPYVGSSQWTTLRTQTVQEIFWNLAKLSLLPMPSFDFRTIMLQITAQGSEESNDPVEPWFHQYSYPEHSLANFLQ